MPFYGCAGWVIHGHRCSPMCGPDSSGQKRVDCPFLSTKRKNKALCMHHGVEQPMLGILCSCSIAFHGCSCWHLMVETIKQSGFHRFISPCLLDLPFLIHAKLVILGGHGSSFRAPMMLLGAKIAKTVIYGPCTITTADLFKTHMGSTWQRVVIDLADVNMDLDISSPVMRPPKDGFERLLFLMNKTYTGFIASSAWSNPPSVMQKLCLLIGLCSRSSWSLRVHLMWFGTNLVDKCS